MCKITLALRLTLAGVLGAVSTPQAAFSAPVHLDTGEQNPSLIRTLIYFDQIFCMNTLLHVKNTSYLSLPNILKYSESFMKESSRQALSKWQSLSGHWWVRGKLTMQSKIILLQTDLVFFALQYIFSFLLHSLALQSMNLILYMFLHINIFKFKNCGLWVSFNFAAPI